ncbi:hypothetical protein [Salinivibrio kushneri]|uniref:hypothetical protein n=1 Tax=Salinivibrio kushneri TaxID=1908198 RepID=UPI0022B2E50B|nr:hypothetical protein [Salinivibrio kushneri]WBA18263.1 hypothetical protein O4598_01865 [Salinivibrio kushneri]
MKLMFTALLASLFLLAGCASEPNINQIQRSELEVDPLLGHKLEVVEIFEERMPQASGESMLRVQFAVRGNSDTRFAWKVNWFNVNDMKVRGVGKGYRRARILSDQTRYFYATAPSAEVKSFQLHIRGIH